MLQVILCFKSTFDLIYLHVILDNEAFNFQFWSLKFEFFYVDVVF